MFRSFCCPTCRSRRAPLSALCSFLWLISASAPAQKPALQSRIPETRIPETRIPDTRIPDTRILDTVDDSHLTTLHGNVHPLARPEFDLGAVEDDQPLGRMVLVLRRSPEQEATLHQLLDNQHSKSSPAYHQWLTPQAFGSGFGVGDRDLSAVTAWLSGQGFSNIQVNSGRTLVEFSGTAGSVGRAFHTSLRHYGIQGHLHLSNASDPAIPAALSPVVAGIASLNNFPRHANSHPLGKFRRDAATQRFVRRPEQAEGSSQAVTGEPGSTYNPAYTLHLRNQTLYGVTPYDFATIYNVLPLWNSGTPGAPGAPGTSIDGTGQTIAIVGETDLNPADFVNFRKIFGLPLGNTNTPTGTQYLNIIRNGQSPGITGEESEADIDTQWSGAVAKGATIDYVVSKSTATTQGTDLSAMYIVDNDLAPIMSYSYGQCELFLGTAQNAFFNALWQQAAAEGITVLVSSGDSGAAGCDNSGIPAASDGIAANGLGSTPYNISVGGTDFYMPNGGAAYWNPTNDPSTQASAKGYIPEVPWNESCTNSVFSTFSSFPGESAEQICNSSTARTDGLLNVLAAGGAPSSCIASDGASVSSCRGGYAKPAWQTGPGVPDDGVRDTPDVSLFSSSGFFGAFYIVCQQSTNSDGQPCNLTSPNYDFSGFGGTSVAAPAFAAILSLVAQKTGGRLGNANYVLYNLAARQHSAGTACNPASGTPATDCIFNDVSTDTNTMPCVRGTPNCNTSSSSDSYGVLSGYNAAPGYDLATGLGSVNAANLVERWSDATFTPSSVTLTLSPSTIVHGSPVTATVAVSSQSSSQPTTQPGTPTGNVAIHAVAANGSVATGVLSNGTFTSNIGSFPGGSYSVQAHYAGDDTFAPSDSNTILLTVSPEGSTTTLSPLLYDPSSNAVTAAANNAAFPYGGIFLLRASVAGLSGQGTATGNIALTDSGAPIDSGTFRLNSTADTEDLVRTFAPGTHTLSAAYSGDTSFNTSQSAPLTLTIVKAQTGTTVVPGATSVSAGDTLSLTVQINALGWGPAAQSGFGAAPPSGTVSFRTATGAALGPAILTQNSYPTAPSDTGTATLTFPANQLTPGSNALSAVYSGDANYQPSSSPAAEVTVFASSLPATTTTLTLSAPAAVSGAPFTFTASVSPRTPLPSGTITFASDGQTIGAKAPLVSGVATLSGNSASLAPGTHRITAIYSGDSSYQASLSMPATFTVTSASIPSVTSITLSSSTVAQGTTVSVAASISNAPISSAPGASNATPTPAGSAQLLLDGSLYGQLLPLNNAAASFPLPTSSLQPGPHIVQVLYGGDSTHLASTSAPASLTILAPAGSFTLSTSSASIDAARGQASGPVTLTITSTGDFHSTVTFACTSGLPPGASCIFAPPTLSPADSDSASTALTISPAPAVSQNGRCLRRGSSGHPASSGAAPSLALLAPFATGILLSFPRRRRIASRRRLLARSRRHVLSPLRRLRAPVGLLLVLSALSCFTGCGNGYVATTIGPSAPTNFAVTVSASGGAIIQTTTIRLTIQ
ncbi:MAG: Ig-like domain repeat protein [Acidobacteriota bacterium]|nr:Ig-like domain repeat protein [Acidobacteriota bacterium]